MKVLVCGGQTYGHIDYKVEQDAELFKERLAQWDNGMSVLDTLDRTGLIIISGMAKGADTIAAIWAEHNGVELEKYYPDWDNYGRAAGIIRNTEMLEEGEPDVVIAFPGGPGTANMVKQAKKCNVKVYEYK